jgi:electron transfer flavoprotein beta subunit
VPDTNEVKLDPVTGTLIREGVPSIINHDDRAGIEVALGLRDKVGGTVSVVSMGPPQADTALREALAMGCDEAYLISGREFGGSDTWATANIIATGLKKVGFDLVITGRQAIDGDTAQVGPQIAENLGVPQVSYVEAVTVEGNNLVVKRQFEDRYHEIEVKPPCLLTMLQEVASPRYMSVGGIFRAYEKDVKTLGFDDLKGGLNPAFIGLKGSPTNVVKSFTKEVKGKGKIHADLSTDDAVAVIMKGLEEKHII